MFLFCSWYLVQLMFRGIGLDPDSVLVWTWSFWVWGKAVLPTSQISAGRVKAADVASVEGEASDSLWNCGRSVESENLTCGSVFGGFPGVKKREEGNKKKKERRRLADAQKIKCRHSRNMTNIYSSWNISDTAALFELFGPSWHGCCAVLMPRVLF